MIVPGDCVIFDTGTTTEQIAMAIPPEMDFEALCFTRNTLERLCRDVYKRQGLLYLRQLQETHP